MRTSPQVTHVKLFTGLVLVPVLLSTLHSKLGCLVIIMPISIATCLYKCQAYFATFQTAFDKYLKDSLDIYIQA